MSRADFDLVRAALRSEPWAVTEIGERMLCLPRFVRLIGRKLHVRIDEEEVAELSQTSFLIVWNKLSEFRGESRLESWAYRIARWEIANALRRRDRAPNQLDDPTTIPEDGVADAEFDEHQRLYESVRRLPPEQGDVILMKHFEGRTFREIAEQLGIPPETAKTRYYRGIQTLRKWLRPKPGDPSA